jgi:hypothetical protein
MTLRRFTLVLFLFIPFPASSQSRASLGEVESLMAQGRILEAREVLETWWDEQGPNVGRMDRQHSLWLRARLTVDPSMAELDLRRLVLEFPGGPYSDDALLRLAQSADLKGDLRQAHAHYTALLRGYPSSPLRRAAEAWLRERGPEVEALGPEPAPGHDDPGALATAGEEGPISVQLGAFRSLDSALSLADQVRGAGFEPRVVRVPGDSLIRVRIGRFRAREDGDALRRELESAGFEATIVLDAGSEERIR